MATIKTKTDSEQVRVITNNVSGERRVSCSCCGECCFYPAEEFAKGTFLAEDLPETLTMYMSDGTSIFGPTTVSSNNDGSYGSYNGGVGPHIEASTGEPNEWIRTYNQIDPGNPCLVFSLESQDAPTVDIVDVWVFDDFQDTYTVETASGDPPDFSAPSGTFTVVRESLCRWVAEGIRLEYNGFIGNMVREAMWTVNGNGRTFDPPYNSPVGTYSDGNSYWKVS